MKFRSVVFIFFFLGLNLLFAQPQDQDGDEIVDSLDQCPSEREIINFYLDQDGCPDEKPDQIKEGVIDGLAFELGTTNFTPNSDSILIPIYEALKAYPGMEIEIGAHVDTKVGCDAKVLTQAQAEAVVNTLHKMGIEAHRLQSVGYGFSRPLGPNRTARGREQNRRIEIHRLN